MPSDPELPFRRACVDTRSPEDIERMQPERHRSVVQLQPGELRFRLHELSWGEAALQSERWSRGVRIRAERPSSYVVFALVTGGAARWMGTPVEPGSVLRVTGPWDCSTEGPFEYVALGIPHATLERAAVQVRDSDQESPLPGNQVVSCCEAPLIATRLLGHLNALEQRNLHPAAPSAASEELLRLALRLELGNAWTPVERFSCPSSRRAAVQRVETYLEAHPDALPSIPTLCEIAGVSERTLEYAFRENLGTTPVRYLKLRRLTLARLKLQDPDSEETSVTDVAIRCGFFELGRFAADYRQLFEELPSATLARRSSGRRSFSARRAPQQPGPAMTPVPTESGAQLDLSKTRTPPQSASTMLPSAHPTP